MNKEKHPKKPQPIVFIENKISAHNFYNSKKPLRNKT